MECVECERDVHSFMGPWMWWMLGRPRLAVDLADVASCSKEHVGEIGIGTYRFRADPRRSDEGKLSGHDQADGATSGADGPGCAAFACQFPVRGLHAHRLRHANCCYWLAFWALDRFCFPRAPIKEGRRDRHCAGVTSRAYPHPNKKWKENTRDGGRFN